jgi:hypothetical protein
MIKPCLALLHSSHPPPPPSWCGSASQSGRLLKATTARHWLVEAVESHWLLLNWVRRGKLCKYHEGTGTLLAVVQEGLGG